MFFCSSFSQADTVPVEIDVAKTLTLRAGQLRAKAPKTNKPASLPDMVGAHPRSIWGTLKNFSANELIAFDHSVDLGLRDAVVKLFMAAAAADDGDETQDDESDQALLTQRSSRFFSDRYFGERGYVDKIHKLPQMRQADWAAMRTEVSHDRTLPSHFAGHPLNDYCAADAGAGVPRNASANISVLDMAMVESTRTSIELSFLHLLDQPDPFAKDLIASEDHSEDEVSVRPWQEVVKLWLSMRGKRPGAQELEEWWARAGSGERDEARDFARSVSQAAEILKKECEVQRGRWQDAAIATESSHHTLFSCFSAPNATGFELFIDEDTEFEDATSLIFSGRSGKFQFEIRLDDLDQTFAIEAKVLEDGQSISSVLLFDRFGRTRGRLSTTGDHYVWDKSGQIAWNGRQDLNGVWLEDITWSQAGLPQAEIRFERNGDIKELVEWFEGGSPSRYLKFDRGRPDGLEQWWHASGILAGEINWYAGKKFGSAKAYFENGQLAFDGSYVDDQLDGYLSWRDELGRKILEAKFSYGNANGKLAIHNGDGVTLASGSFEQGRVEGEFIIGIDRQRGGAKLPFKSGLLDGDVSFYDSSGTLKMVLPYRSGKLHGRVRGFYAPEQEAASCEFDDGHLQNWKVTARPNVMALYNIEGRVLDRDGGKAEISATNTATSTRVDCTAQKDLWTECKWTMADKVYQLDSGKLHVFWQRINKAKGKCAVRVIEWNFKSWIEQNKPYAFLEAEPGKTCSDKRLLVCRVDISPGLPVATCEHSPDDQYHGHH